jgi:hypothetical protein
VRQRPLIEVGQITHLVIEAGGLEGSYVVMR